MFLNNNRNCGFSMQQAAANSCCQCPTTDETVTALPENVAVAMAYVPFQTDNAVYPVEQAVLVGTLFPVLNKPFTGVHAGCGRT